MTKAIITRIVLKFNYYFAIYEIFFISVAAMEQPHCRETGSVSCITDRFPVAVVPFFDHNMSALWDLVVSGISLIYG